ncbi:MAG: flagellar filament capping protein FliD [Eubacteriales bacterium]
MSTTSVSGSSTVNGLYSNANAISGLVSGLDTESMIEGLVDSYNMKIIGFQQSIVTQQWQQNAYRDVIADLQAFSTKYTSFSNQSSNLSSQTFWNSAITTVAQGENADKVSVSGSTDVPVSVDAVLQTATSSQVISSKLSESNDMSTALAENVDLSEKSEVGLLSGYVTLNYGSSKVTIEFDDTDILDNNNDSLSTGQALANLINDKLKSQTISGDPASTRMEAVYNNSTGQITFNDLNNAGNDIFISSASSGLKSTLGITASTSYDKSATFMAPSRDMSKYVDEVSNASLIDGQTITVNYNGSSSTFRLAEETDYKKAYASGEFSGTYADYVTSDLNDQLAKKFGTSVTVTNEGDGKSNELQLSFNITSTTNGNTLNVTSTAGKFLGFGGNTLSNSISTSDSLDKILGEGVVDSSTVDYSSKYNGTYYNSLLKDGQSYLTAVGSVSYNTATKEQIDSDGDTVVNLGSDDEPQWVKLNKDGDLRVGEILEINGEEVGVFDGDSTLQDVIDAINSSDAGVTVAYSSLTNNVVFTSKETGAASEINFGGGLAEKLFGNTGESYNENEYTSADVSTELDAALADSTIDVVVGFGSGDDAKTYTLATDDTGTPTETVDEFVARVNKDLDGAAELTYADGKFTMLTESNDDAYVKIGDDLVLGKETTETVMGQTVEIDLGFEFADADKALPEDYSITIDNVTYNHESLVTALKDKEGDSYDDSYKPTYNDMLGFITSYYGDNERFVTTDDGVKLTLRTDDEDSYKVLVNHGGVGEEDTEINSTDILEDVVTTAGTSKVITSYDGASDSVTANQGKNAIMVVSVNGEQLTLERSTNTFDIEGLTVTANKVFNNTDAEGNTIDLTVSDWTSKVDDLVMDDVITFEEEKDFDEIVDTVKEMVTAYNEMMSKIKNYFTEVPLSTTSGTGYLPLTDEDANSMTEAAVDSYNEKAQTGILFGDSNMRSLYNSLSTVFSTSGSFGIDVYNMGFSVGFGTTASEEMLDFDEDAFRKALDTDLETVMNAFTSTTAAGGADGVMAKMSASIESYASVTGATKGILVNAAGTELSALSLLSNSMQDKIDNFQEMIVAWEERLSNKVDFYTSQFSKLEVIMANANSQSSALAGLGGY